MAANFFTVGIHELSRKATRLWLRACHFLLRKKLRKAEIELGWLGWQQADYFDPELHAQIEKIEQFEREQAQLLNVSADFSAMVSDLETQRAAQRAQFENELAQIRSDREPVEKSTAELESQLREQRVILKRFRAALTELKKLPKPLAKRHAELLAIEPQTAETRAELLRIRDEEHRIAGEKEELQKQSLRAEKEIELIEIELNRSRAQLDESMKIEHEVRKKFENVDRKLVGKIRECRREIHFSSKHMNVLDSKKSEPFLIIGRALADSDIAPINQPQALAHVHNLRLQIETTLRRIGQSRTKSAQADRVQVLRFYVLAFAIILIAFCALAARIR